jgi:hypothetical protein
MPVALPGMATPMVRPVSVTVTAALAVIDCVVIVMTIWVVVCVATLPVGGLLPLICTRGVPVLEKKLGGYVSVMVSTGKSAPPAVGVKVNVAAQPVLPATRSDVAIANEVLIT